MMSVRSENASGQIVYHMSIVWRQIIFVFSHFRTDEMKLCLWCVHGVLFVCVFWSAGDRKGSTANRGGDSGTGSCRKGEGEDV